MQILQYILLAIIAISFLTAAHWLVYKTLARFFSLENPHLIAAAKFLPGFLTLLFIFSMIVASGVNNFFSRALYIFSATWIGFMYYFVLTSAFCWIVYRTAKIFNATPNQKIIGGVLFALALVIGLYGIFAASNVRVVRINIKLPNLPPSWQGKTAVWISDTHLGEVWSQTTAQRLAQKIKDLEPDIVFIGGDLYDGVKADYRQLAEPFGNIPASKGVYFITGNHEEFSDDKKYLDAIAASHIKILNNELTDIDGLQIIGVSWNNSSGAENFKTAIQQIKIDKTKPSILLKHAPLNLDIAQQAGISLQISGHTHFGQIFPNNLITYLVYKGYDYGLKLYGNMFVYTSSGAGTWGPPLRVGAPLEIVIFKFE